MEPFPQGNCGDSRVRFLEYQCFQYQYKNFSLSRGLEYFPDKLKFLYWYQYPSTYLPSNFSPKNLVELHLIHSHIEQLFNGQQNIENLKYMDLSYSMKLTAIPDLSKIPKLETLNLKGCIRLVEIYSSEQYDCNLIDVNLGYCKSLCRFSSFVQFRKLKFLSLQGCSKITKFPSIPSTIESLVLNETAVEQVPVSVGHSLGLTVLELKACEKLESIPNSIGELRGLEKLDLEGCSKLMNLPDSICNLQSLKTLAVAKCRNLNELPENLGNLQSLKWFYANESSIRRLPPSVTQLSNLRKLICDGCNGLVLPHFTECLSRLRIVSLKNCGLSELDESFGSLVSLVRLYVSGNDLETVPESLKKLPSLYTLELTGCKKLKYLSHLPPALVNLIVRNCTNLESILFENGSMDSLRSLDAANCSILDQNTSRLLLDDVLLSHQPTSNQEFLEDGNELQVRTIVGSEVPKRIRYQNCSGYCLSCSLTTEPSCFISLAFCAVAAPNDYLSRHFCQWDANVDL